ncbi:hypothetical protein CBS147346_10920 [Aspergillus niger]|nr:hypothetical protein CBS147346_10920 [Aspergillus niger]
MSSYPLNRPQDRSVFGVAIICALSLEAGAMIALFDEFWEHDAQYQKAHGDTNSYTIGRIGSNHVVLVHMPHIGKVSAANVAANLRSSFPQIRLSLLVGICGGVPFIDNGKHEITLGDIVISTHIVQTDFGRQYSDSFIRKDTPQDNLGRPNPEIKAFLSNLQVTSVQTKLEAQTQTHLMTVLGTKDFKSAYPGVHEDRLYESAYRHKHQNTQPCAICAKSIYPEDSVCQTALSLSCAELGCDASRLIPRSRIQNAINNGGDSHNPVIHFGAVASGDQVIKSAQHRDRIAEQENVIAFEMEGAGFWDSIPTIVVKGVCDYADSHKNKGWQLYAAATAAACAKSLLQIWRPMEKPSQDQHQGKALFPQSSQQSFGGNFNAGKNNYNGNTYTAQIMNFE